MKRTWLSISIFMLLCAVPASAREAGWVPLPSEPWVPPGKTVLVKPQRKSAPIQKIPGHAGTVYEGQKPIAEEELEQFLVLLPEFRSWAAARGEEAHPVVDDRGQPDFLYSPSAAQWVASHGIAPARFFCIMGKMAASLVIIEEGNDFTGTRPKDMPRVEAADIALARRHLSELLTAGAVPAPMR